MKLLVLGICLMALSTCQCGFPSLTDCEDSIRNEEMSSDGNNVATLFERNCGATTGYSTIVSLRSAESSFDGNDDGNVVLIVKDDPEIDVAWRDNSTLQIRCDNCPDGNVFKKQTHWRNITIIY